MDSLWGRKESDMTEQLSLSRSRVQMAHLPPSCPSPLHSESPLSRSTVEYTHVVFFVFNCIYLCLAGFSLQWLLLLQTMGSRAQAQQLQHTGSVALRCVASSQAKDWTCVPSLAGKLIHWTTREKYLTYLLFILCHLPKCKLYKAGILICFDYCCIYSACNSAWQVVGAQ